MPTSIETMSNAELLGVLVGQRHAPQLLRNSDGSLSRLLNEPVPVAYVPPRAGSRLQAAAELVRRSLFEQVQRRDAMTSPAEVRAYLRMTLVGREHEVFLVMFLNSQHHVLAAEEMFRGTLDQTAVYPREIVKRCLMLNASAVILAHNHPSGVPEPSRADEMLTKTLKNALSLIDTRVLDHFIVARDGVVSLAERGLI